MKAITYAAVLLMSLVLSSTGALADAGGHAKTKGHAVKAAAGAAHANECAEGDCAKEHMDDTAKAAKKAHGHSTDGKTQPHSH